MSLTILSVAYPFTHVGPDASGGSEQILTTLDRQLTAAGHKSLVIAVEGSKIKGQLIASPQFSGELNPEVRRWGQRTHGRLLLETLNRYSVDLVHFHSLDFHAYLPCSSVPTLATLHLPISWYPTRVFHEKRKNFYVNCVSSSQSLDCPPSNKVMPFIRNGIDVSSFDCGVAKEPYVLGLGRLCPEKGFHHALDAARLAGVRMVLAGELFTYAGHLEYFEEEIKPRLDDMRTYVGPVGCDLKRELLSRASALLVPSVVAETSSLVTMEALASGTPVVAFRVGAIPELVEDGKTGYLVDDSEEMAWKIGQAAELSTGACRELAHAKCDSFQMGARYLELYRRIVGLSYEAKDEHYVHAGVSWLADVP